MLSDKQKYSMNRTKQKILEASLKLFNDAGTIQIVLQKIADESNISIGNLTYHFKNKEAIIVALFDVIDEDISSIFSKVSLMPTEEEIMEIEHKLFELQDRYRFLFLDSIRLINTSKIVADKFRENMKHQIDVIVTLMNIGAMTGTYKTEEYEGQYLQVAKIVWNIYFSRITRSVVMDEKYELIDLANDIWLLVKPFLTEEGVNKYKPLLEAKMGAIH